MDEELERLVLREWEFVRKSKNIPAHLKSHLGELIEAYVRSAYKIALKTSCKPL